MEQILDVLQLAAIFGVGGLGLILIREMRDLKDEMRLLQEALNSRLPPKAL